jgi:O-antigen/teichoic acid export membrane protein
MKLTVPITVIIVDFAGPIVHSVFDERYVPAADTLGILALGVLAARYA